MATTSLIVEIVVIGIFALLWVGLFLMKLLGLDAIVISNWLSQYSDWSSGIIFLSIVIAYQLGWSINQISYFIARNTFSRTIKKKILKNNWENYKDIKAAVFIKGSKFAVDNIRERLSVVRLTRSAFVNMFLISVGLFVLEKWYLGLVAIGITLIIFFQAYDTYAQYCRQICDAYKIINSNDKKSEKRIEKKEIRTK